MRININRKLALRVLSTAALMSMVSSIATAAFAGTYYLEDGDITVNVKDDGHYVTQGELYKDARDQDDQVTITSRDKETTKNVVTVTVEDNATANVTIEDAKIEPEYARDDSGKYKGGITVDTKGENAKANITLDNVNVKNNSGSALEVKGKGDTEIELNGDNTLIGGYFHAGLEKADDVSQGSLTIKDDKNNDGSEKAKDEDGYSTGGNTGTLIVAGGCNGAGIGGRKNYYEQGEADTTCTSTSNITITGGQIKAGALIDTVKEYPDTRQDGAGIGGAPGNGNATNITITGNADVTAAGGYYSAGIGGGDKGSATNITISGNAKVTATGSGNGGAGIGGGEEREGVNIRITDNADVTAYGGEDGAGIGGGRYCGGSVEISGNAKVKAVGANGSAGIGSGADGGYSKKADTSVTISDNANVTAIGSSEGAAIGTGRSCTQGKTTINITGGTVTAIGGKSTVSYWNGNCYKDLTSAIGGSHNYGGSDSVQDVTVNINGTTGNTTVNASCWLDQKSAISTGDGAADIIGYDEDGKSPFGEDGSVIVRMYNHGSYTRTGYGPFSKYEGDLTGYNLGTLYQTVHNRTYMDENTSIDTSNLKDEDLHDWQLVGKVVEPTLEEDGYADYVCSIDKCGQTKHVVLPKLTPEPSEPDVPGGNTPDTPNKPDAPKQPDGNTPAPVTPDAPAQDKTPAEAEVLPAADGTEAGAPAQQTAVTTAAALPQTGANWLAVVGSAISGMVLLAAGFVLDRRNRRMN